MSDPYLAEIKIVSFAFAPRGWAFCNGQLLTINQNQALFSLLGTTYGGNGITTFGLPNLQARVPLHTGNSFVLGQSGGEAAHTLSLAEMPGHVHTVSASSAAPDQTTPLGNNLATFTTDQQYSPLGSPLSAMLDGTTPAGGNQAHTNLQPYLVLNFIIALQGVFPSRNFLPKD